MDGNGHQNYTIEDIARALGLSKSTVSRAISGKGRMRVETRERVLRFIEEHNYRPNAVAQSLAHSRSGNIGLVLPGGGPMEGRFFTECMRGVCDSAAAHHYDVLLAMEGGPEQMRRILTNQKVDGVIAARSERNSPILPLLKAHSVPFVIIGQSSDPDVFWVDNDNRGGSRELCARLLGRGLYRLALLGGDDNFVVTHSRLQGFQDAYREAGFTVPQTVYLNIRDPASASAAVTDALTQGVRALLCMDGFICDLALLQLAERGIEVPRQLRVACLYDDELMEHLLPPVTSLHYDAVTLGRVACEMLLQQLDSKVCAPSAQPKPATRILPGYRLIERASTL